jgi:hypothetical protein
MSLYVVYSFDHCIHYFLIYGLNPVMANVSRCITQCVQIASGAHGLIKACSPLLPTITRATAVHI